ncbi:MAG: hypothetical protein GMKNLPBB_00731 [Myxococcota bacterium]|nr:hypothetical protein [Myxococcota bacterium]
MKIGVMARSSPHPKAPQVNIPGEWMFRSGGTVQGPAPAQVIVDRLYRGELDDSCEATPAEITHWRPLREIPEFVEWAGKAARERALHQQRLEAETARSRRNLLAGAVAVLLLGAVGVAGWGWMRMRKKSPAAAAPTAQAPAKTAPTGTTGAQPPAAALAKPPSVGDNKAWIKRPPPIISIGNMDEFVAAAVGAPKAAKPPKAGKALAAAAPQPKQNAPSGETAPPPPPAPAGPGETAPPGGGGGEDMDVDEGQVSATDIYSRIRRNIPRLLPCFEADRDRNEDNATSRVVIQFVLQPSGSPGSVAVAEPDSPDEAFRQCLVAAVNQWKFPAFNGNGREIRFPVYVK